MLFDINGTYKTAYEFFNQVSNAPEIHVVFIYFGDILHVIFGVNTCKYKCTVHNEHWEKQHLNQRTIQSIIV